MFNECNNECTLSELSGLVKHGCFGVVVSLGFIFFFVYFFFKTTGNMMTIYLISLRIGFIVKWSR